MARIIPIEGGKYRIGSYGAGGFYEVSEYIVEKSDGSRYKSFPADQYEQARECCEYLQALENQEKLIKLQQENLKIQQENLSIQKRANTGSATSELSHNFIPKPLPSKEYLEKQERERKKKEQYYKTEQDNKNEISNCSNPQQIRKFFNEKYKNKVYDGGYHYAFIRNLNTPSDVLEKIYHNSTNSYDMYGLRKEILAHKNVPVSLLRTLIYIDNSSGKVRCNNMRMPELVALNTLKINPNTPTEIKNLIERKLKQNAKKDNEGCYIATACYGKYDCIQVLTFRNFRDEYLSKTFVGRMFIKIYYALSPNFAKWLKNKHKTNTFIRESCLDRIYESLKDKY